MSDHKAAWAEVRVGDLAHNLRVVRSDLKEQTAVCGILKADAYGHGLSGVMQKLSELRLVDMAAVGKISELALANSVPVSNPLQILLLGTADVDEIEAGIARGIFDPGRSIFSVYSLRQFRKLENAAKRLSVRIRVHIRADGWNTGMGFGYEEFLKEEEALFSSDYLEICGLYSHLYTSYTEDKEKIGRELERFDGFVRAIRPDHRKQLTVHILNSGLVFRFPEYAYDMVRVGTALYGLPCWDGGRLRPVMRICAEIFEVCDVDSSVPLSYESSLSGSGNKRIARIMIGYWDIPLLLTQKDIRIRIRGRLFVPADDLCMDNLCIDITGQDDISPGDLAVLLGEEGVTIEEILKRNRIPYTRSEWLCMTAGRLEKVYL